MTLGGPLTTGRLPRTRPLPVAGGLASLGAIAGIASIDSLPVSLLIGAAGVALVCSSRLALLPTALAIILCMPFAMLVALDASPIAGVRTAVFLTASLGAVASSRVEELWRVSGLTPILLLISAAGVFLAVPDTEEAAVLLVATVPGALAAWPWRFVTLGRAGAASVTVVLAWVVAVGGRGRPPSVAGGLACLGLLIWLVGGQWMRSRLARLTTADHIDATHTVLLVLGAHAALVVVASRIAGVSNHLVFAMAVAIGTAVAGLVAAGVVPRHPVDV